MLGVGGVLNSDVAHEKYESVGNVTLNRLKEGHLFIVQKLRQKGRVLPPLTSPEKIETGRPKIFTDLCVRVCK